MDDTQKLQNDTDKEKEDLIEKKDVESSVNDQNNEIDIAKQRDEYLDGWKRAKADLINYKKEEAKRFEHMLHFANEQVIKELLIVLDSFDLALTALGGESKVEKGVYLIRAQLEDILKKYGLERVMVSVGREFDPALHDAIASTESDQPSGTVLEEIEKGYTLNGKLIRAARVRVAK